MLSKLLPTNIYLVCAIFVVILLFSLAIAQSVVVNFVELFPFSRCSMSTILKALTFTISGVSHILGMRRVREGEAFSRVFFITCKQREKLDVIKFPL